MAYRVFQNGENIQQDVKKLIIDSNDDVSTLGTTTSYGAGSQAVAVNDGNMTTYILSPSGIWTQISS